MNHLRKSVWPLVLNGLILLALLVGVIGSVTSVQANFLEKGIPTRLATSTVNTGSEATDRCLASGRTWCYSDLSGVGISGSRGALPMIGRSDTIAPAAPTNLTVRGTTAGGIGISRIANGLPDLAGYEIYRQQMPPETDFDVTSPVGIAGGTFSYDGLSSTSIFTPDMHLVAKATHTVTVSGNSDIAGDVQQVPLLWTIESYARMVSVTIAVTVPDFTPGTVYIFGNQPELGDWDPGVVPMTQSGPVTWTIALNFLENTPLAFNFGRGSVETEETEIDGNTFVLPREVTVTSGPGGTQSETYSVANWRDPIVVDHFPADGASNQPIDTAISVSWSQATGVGTDFLVVGPDGPISGTFTYYANTYTYVFTPSALLAVGATYTVTAAGQIDAGGDSQQVPAQFSFDTMVPTSVELVTLAEKTTITDSWWWVSWPWLMVLMTAVSLVGLVWIKRRRRQAFER